MILISSFWVFLFLGFFTVMVPLSSVNTNKETNVANIATTDVTDEESDSFFGISFSIAGFSTFYTILIGISLLLLCICCCCCLIRRKKNQEKSMVNLQPHVQSVSASRNASTPAGSQV